MPRPPISPIACSLLAFCLLAAAEALAARVSPTEHVRSHVIVRAEARPGSAKIGKLRPGQQAELLASVADWHRVRLAGGAAGFVSRQWTRVLPGPEPKLPAPAKPRVRAPLRGLLRSAEALLRPEAPVDFLLREPAADRTRYRDRDPRLPVSGVATAAGSRGSYDIVIVLDASSSTREFSEADVDGDGRLEDVWQGPDSIFRAEVAAARELVASIARLPGNRQGQRIRVGVVTFAGDETLYRLAGDREFDATPGAIIELAKRDAELRIRLGADYERLDRELARLAEHEPRGMTNFAAGLGRALVELGALHAPGDVAARADVEQLVLFVTDGKPRLPFDREVAEKVALQTARLAAGAGVRVHSFHIGSDAVTRTVNEVLGDMARRTGGRLVELEAPGEIVSALRNTSFSFVEGVTLANRTRDVESDYIATGIDGSFYGEIELAEGENEIEVIATLSDGRTATERLVIDYVRGAPEHELRQQLAALRRENEALIEKIRRKLSVEMEKTRRQQDDRQRKSLELATGES